MTKLETLNMSENRLSSINLQADLAKLDMLIYLKMNYQMQII